MAYKNEAAFSRALSDALRKQGAIVTRIETGMTSQGVPDMFVQFADDDIWLELKNMPSLVMADILDKGFVKVQWRPGQQAWAMNYYRKHDRKKCTLTVVAGANHFFVIRMDRLWSNNKVMEHDVSVCAHLQSLVMHIHRIIEGKFPEKEDA